MCAVVTSPSTGCPSAVPFSVNLFLNPGSAGNMRIIPFPVLLISNINYVIADSSDYMTDAVTLDFSTCSRRRCARINIENDIQVEEDEYFKVFLQSSDQQLTLSLSTATIEINNDNDGMV